MFSLQIEFKDNIYDFSVSISSMFCLTSVFILIHFIIYPFSLFMPVSS